MVLELIFSQFFNNSKFLRGLDCFMVIVLLQWIRFTVAAVVLVEFCS